MTEAALHRSIASYLRAVLPPDVFATTFPAGGGGRVRGAQLKAAGLVPGCPDVLICFDGKAHWIELKTPKGRVSDVQGMTHARLWAAGCPCVIARSIDDVEKALQGWSIPLRASVRRAA